MSPVGTGWITGGGGQITGRDLGRGQGDRFGRRDGDGSGLLPGHAGGGAHMAAVRRGCIANPG